MTEVCPSLLGSCVLVRLDSSYYAFTAAHVLRDAGSAQLWAPPRGKGEKFLRLPWSAAHLSPAAVSHDLDVGVLALPASALGAFEQRVFLNGLGVDEDDQPDDGGLASFYFVLGYPASRTQVKVSCQTRLIDVKSFSSTTSPVAAGEYLQENLLRSDYLLLNFDHKDIAIRGVRVRSAQVEWSQRRRNFPSFAKLVSGSVSRDCDGEPAELPTHRGHEAQALLEGRASA